MQENYKILGLTELATDAEVDQAYNLLKEKYQKERFYEGEIGNEAAKQLTKLETAYREIKAERATFTNDNCCFEDVEKLIKDGNIAAAQNKLDEFSDRNAEWHYLQAVIFYKKNWNNESKKQLEIALSIDPDNKKYVDAYSKLKQKWHIQKEDLKACLTTKNTTNKWVVAQMIVCQCALLGVVLICCATDVVDNEK